MFHFTTAETALVYILPTLKLHLSSFTSTNDPRENKTFNFWQICETVMDTPYLDEIRNGLKDFLDHNCRILCFSNDYMAGPWFMDGFNHPRLWAQYAKNHNGVCLVLNKEIVINENTGLFFEDVEYQLSFNFPSVNLEEYLSYKNKDDYFRKFLKENYKAFFYTKHIDWQSEHESRLVSLDNVEYYSIENSLCGIYLGESFDYNLLPTLNQNISGKDIWKRKVYMSDGRLHSLIFHDN